MTSGVSRRAALLTAATLGLGVFCLWLFFMHQTPPDSDLPTRTVDRGEVLEFVVQPGRVTSARVTTVLNEIEPVRYGEYHATGGEILWMVPDRSVVDSGALLVELNSALLKEVRDDWQLKVVAAEAAYKQADIGFQNQVTKRETELANALTLLEDFELLQTAFAAAREPKVAEKTEQTVADTENVRVQQLLSRIADAMKAIGAAGAEATTPDDQRYAYQLMILKLGQALGDLEITKKYEQPLQAKEIDEAVKSAQRALLQSQHDHELVLQQLATARAAARQTLDQAQTRLDHFDNQIEKCKIAAPHAGVVMYASAADGALVCAGAVVDERQPILTLYDPSLVQIDSPVPSTEARRIHVDATAVIYLDNPQSPGIPARVTDLKSEGDQVQVIVTPEDGTTLRLGEEATVEIHVHRLPTALRVPRASTFRWDDQTHCYVQSRDTGVWERRAVVLGVTGAEYCEVVQGLQEGDVIAAEALTAVEQLEPALLEPEQLDMTSP